MKLGLLWWRSTVLRQPPELLTKFGVLRLRLPALAEMAPKDHVLESVGLLGPVSAARQTQPNWQHVQNLLLVEKTGL